MVSLFLDRQATCERGPPPPDALGGSQARGAEGSSSPCTLVFKEKRKRGLAHHHGHEEKKGGQGWRDITVCLQPPDCAGQQELQQQQQCVVVVLCIQPLPQDTLQRLHNRWESLLKSTGHLERRNPSVEVKGMYQAVCLVVKKQVQLHPPQHPSLKQHQPSLTISSAALRL